MPKELKAEANRVQGCQSTVFVHARKKPGSADVMEFLADSDADVVRGLLAVLQKVYSGQHASAVLSFDAPAFWQRLGLDRNLTTGRRNGLGAMVERLRAFAAGLVERKEPI
jgi:cysteine desulfurase/selenocysteine lyase